MSGPSLIISIFTGIGLAAAAGFRIFLPLFALSIAARMHLMPLNEKFAWLGSDIALAILFIATIVEIGAYLIPWVDHMLDAIAIPLAGIAGTFAVGATLTDLDPAVTWALALIAGGGTATAVQASTSTTRVASTATTGGLANPVFGAVESVMSFIFSLLAFVMPVLGVILLLVIGYFVFKIFRKKKQKSL